MKEKQKESLEREKNGIDENRSELNKDQNTLKTSTSGRILKPPDRWSYN